MLAKFGFVLLFLVFGLLMFLLGASLSEEARLRFPQLEKLRPAKPPVPPMVVPAAPGKPPSQAGKAGADPKAPPPQPLETLLIPAPAPKAGRYALQAGIFPDPAQADALVARIAALHLPGVKARTLAMRDREGRDWWVAAAGERDAPESLEDIRAWLGDRIALADARAILLPPEPKP